MRASDERASTTLREVAGRAVRRLNVLEYVILGTAALLALLAGALAAFLLEAGLDLPFRPTWVVASLALFVVPAAVALARERKLQRGKAERRAEAAPGETPDGDRKTDGG